MDSIVLEYRLYKNDLSFEPLYHYTSLGSMRCSHDASVSFL